MYLPHPPCARRLAPLGALFAALSPSVRFFFLPPCPGSMAEAAPADAETEAACDADAEGQEAESTAGSLHISCKDFVRCPPGIVEKWVKEMSPVPLEKFFKMKKAGYAFITVLPEHDEAFRAALQGLTFRKEAVLVQDGKKRKADCAFGRADGEEDGDRSKRARVQLRDFPEGYVPTLKDIVDKEKKRKREVEATVQQKTVPLYSYSYDVQLNMKGTHVKSAVRSFTKKMLERSEQDGLEPPSWTTPEWSLGSAAPVKCGCPLDAPVGTPEEHRTGYRNKCEFTIGYTPDGEIECGAVLRVSADGNQCIESIDDLPHPPERMKALCRAVREHVKASAYTVYDRRRGEDSKGVWRLIMARLSPEGKLMVLLQVANIVENSEQQREFSQNFTEALTGKDAADLGVVSIYLQINDTSTDAARPDASLIHIHGVERLEMPLLGLKYEIGPMSFFQVNSATCALLYQKALDWVRPGSIFFDVCCGVGTIGLSAAKHCSQVFGLELIPEAVESAKQNAALNKIENAHFRAGKAEETLPQLLRELTGEEDVCAIVDPPRPGLHKDVLVALRSCKRLSRLVYVSCNPESLAEDVVKLCLPQEGQDPFVPVRAVAVDMFPHTLHVEMVLLLERASKVPDFAAIGRGMQIEHAKAIVAKEASLSAAKALFPAKEDGGATSGDAPTNPPEPGASEE